MERNYNKRHLRVVRRRLIESSATISYALSTIGITEMDTRDGYNSSWYDSMFCCYAR
jgi:hypothetical protein